MATAMPSTNRVSAGSAVRSAIASSALDQRRAGRASSASARRSSRAELTVREPATRSRAPIGASPAVTASASSSATVGSSASMRSSRCCTWAAEPVVAHQYAAAAATMHSATSGTGCPTPSSVRSAAPGRSPTTAPRRAPDDLLEPELLHASSGHPPVEPTRAPTRRRRATVQPAGRIRRRTAATQALDASGTACGSGRRSSSRDGRRGVAQVGVEPVAQPRATHERAAARA